MNNNPGFQVWNKNMFKQKQQGIPGDMKNIVAT